VYEKFTFPSAAHSDMVSAWLRIAIGNKSNRARSTWLFVDALEPEDKTSHGAGFLFVRNS
jgi:hypothetical protein